MRAYFRSVAFALTVILGICTSRAATAADDGTLTKVGDKSPVSSVRTVDGNEVKLEGQVVLLNFFATWCGPCMMEMPHLEKDLWKPLKKEGFVLVAVGREHSETEVKAFRDKNQFTFTFAADPKREIFGKFAKQSIPRCVLIGKDGHIKFQSIGYAEKEFDTLVQAVKAELSGSQR